MPLLHLTSSPLDLASVVDAVAREADARHGTVGSCGAVATFLGVVRARNAGRRVIRLEYEAYEALAARVFERIATEVRQEWPGTTLGLHHRVGVVEPGVPSVAIVAAAPHRAEAFAACRYAIERVKQVAPIWKRERFDDGDVWVEGATADLDDASARQEALRRACA